MKISLIFAVIFSIAGIINLFLGIYILYINPKSKMNIMYFFATIALEFWSFGFSMAISGNNISDVLFWRRFSAIGWGAFFSILLHFFLLYTGKDNLLKKWWIYLLLYTPTVVTYLGFTYIPGINPNQYNMVLSPLGWINVAVNNGWDRFYAVYYILYSVIGFYLVWQWGRKNRNLKLKKQSYFILFSFLFTMIMGSLTDILCKEIFSVSIPQLAPVLMLFPTIVVYYTIKRYGLMNPKHVGEEAILMTDQIRTKIINYMSFAFIVGGLLNFISEYLLSNQDNLRSVLIFSGLLIILGLVFQFIQHTISNNNTKDILNAIVFSLIVPVITLKFIDDASVTIWAFPFLLLIITLVFGSGYIQITLMISIVLTQTIVWIMKPEITVMIGAPDHVVRLGLFMITIWFAFFVKKTYMAKLNENAEQINIQKLISEISADFVSINERNINDKFENTLLKIGTFMKTDRAYVYLFDENKENLICKYVWFNNEIMTDSSPAKIVNVFNFPQIMQHIQGGNTIVLSDTADIIAEVGDEIPQFVNSNEKAFIAIPLFINNVVYGFLGIETKRRTKMWHDLQLGFFKIIANILGDALEKVKQEREINYIAFYDYLTKLPNRLLFKDRATQAINLAMRTTQILAIIFLDLDSFKAVNDSIGHDGGDSLLIKVSEKLSDLIRKSDTVSRFGGDEFLILLDNLNSVDDIAMLARKILSAFDKPFIINGQEYFVTASAGVAVYPVDGENADMLIKNADIAMYKAKEKGRNQHLFCTSDMKNEIVMKMKLTNSLYRALERDEFILHYQPQVCAKTKKVIAAEALIRWNHSELGMIPPSVFIPLAEQNGLIGSIGEWVLRTACMQCKAWQLSGLPAIRIAVNISVIQFRNPNLISQIHRILKETQLEPQYLELEITESVAVNESEYIIDVLNTLKKSGISISIDDFGTEYSSLSRLTSMPIDRIKMDMQFIRSIHKSDKDNAIALGIIGLAHNLGLKVIAEGVETKIQLDFLSQKKCDEIQGFYFYRPVNAEDFEKILRG